MKDCYVTFEMAKEASGKSVEASIKCSAMKWRWFGNCTRDEFAKKVKHIGYYCSICMDTFCRDCPLGRTPNKCSKGGSIYTQARHIYEEWKKHPTLANFYKFQTQARKLAQVIERLKP